MQTAEPCHYSIELPMGIPVPSGHFGIAIQKAGKERSLSFFHDWDLLFIEKGNCILQLRNKKTFRVPEGFFLLLPPSFPVWLRYPSPTRLSFCHFSFKPIPDNVFLSVRNDCLELGKRVLIPMIFPKSKSQKIWQAYQRVIAMEFDIKRPWRMACAISRLVAELGAFALKLNLPDDHPSLSPSEDLDPRIIDVCRRIARNPVFPWKVSELAESVGISIGHLDRLFHSNLRIKLKGFIVEQRLQRALRFVGQRQILERQSIKEISTACGFSSQHFFSRQFKKYYGVSPSKYRFSKDKVRASD